MKTLSKLSAQALTAKPEAGTYLHWGVVQISLGNLLLIVVMLVVFVLALVVPFARAHRDDRS